MPEGEPILVWLFHDAETGKPAAHETVLVRAWGERKRHYVYALATYEHRPASRRWVDHARGDTLWFEPVSWARLPQPEPSDA